MPPPGPPRDPRREAHSRPTTRGGEAKKSTYASHLPSHPVPRAAGAAAPPSHETLSDPTAASNLPRTHTKPHSHPNPILVTARVPSYRDVHNRDDSRRKPSPALKQNHSRRPDNFFDDARDEDDLSSPELAFPSVQFPRTPDHRAPVVNPEINIVVLGQEGVGKSTFLQRALGLSAAPTSRAAEKKLPTDKGTCLVRLLEIHIDDVQVDEFGGIEWPGTIQNNIMPKVDGSITMYDVNDKESLKDIRRVLDAISKSHVPSVLLSGKCDTPLDQRVVDPDLVEIRAKQEIAGLSTAKISDAESCRRAISLALKSIVPSTSNNSSDNQYSSARWILSSSRSQEQLNQAANRRRAQSSAVRRASPTGDSAARMRSDSEKVVYHKDQVHARHDSTITGDVSADRSKVSSGAFEDELHRTFLLEESGDEDASSRPSSQEGNGEQQADSGPDLSASLVESGALFEELVDRLLAQPSSKADSKFATIFLALYRKFAAPSQLLDAIISRFDNLDRSDGRPMIKTVEQLRYTAIVEQWLSAYPGDFARVGIKQKMRDFILRLSQYRIFAVSAKEMSGHLDQAVEDDDTLWACADTDEVANEDKRTSIMTQSADGTSDVKGNTSSSVSANASRDDGDPLSQTLLNAESAQREVQRLQPLRREALTKVHWRMLMDLTDELIAKELTRMDWFLFCAVRPRDFVRQVSAKAPEKEKYRNMVYVNKLTDHFNHLAKWVTNFILLREKPKHRALMLEKFMRVARKLRELNNYNALGAVIAGVTNSAIHRLLATRELIPPAVAKDWLKLEILMSTSRSFTSYRLAWENSSSERIPYIPLHRRDLASAEEGNKTYVGDEADGRINWKKFEVMGDVIVSMQRAQGQPYKSLGTNWRDPIVKDLVFDVKLETDDEVLWARSQALEPQGGNPTSAAAASSKFIKDLFKR